MEGEDTSWSMGTCADGGGSGRCQPGSPALKGVVLGILVLSKRVILNIQIISSSITFFTTGNTVNIPD